MKIIGNKKPLFYGGVYMLLILLFSLVYLILPHGNINYGDVSQNFFTALYFSVVTITTLGYGDILPVSNLALVTVSAECILGIITIGFFLNAISVKISENASAREKAKIKKNKKINEIEKLLRYEKLFRIDINNYEEYATIITTPINKRNDMKYNPDFTLNDMCDLYKVSLRQTDCFHEPAVVKYYVYRDNFMGSLEKMLLNTSLGMLGELEKEGLELTNFCKKVDFKDIILSAPNIKLGDETLSDFDARLLKLHEGEVRYKTSNNINAYVNLFHQIKKTMQFINMYNEAISKLKIDYKELL